MIEFEMKVFLVTYITGYAAAVILYTYNEMTNK